jgi:hypothetical protein
MKRQKHMTNSNKKTIVCGAQIKKIHCWSCKYAVEVSQLANGDAVKWLVRIESGKEVSER